MQSGAAADRKEVHLNAFLDRYLGPATAASCSAEPAPVQAGVGGEERNTLRPVWPWHAGNPRLLCPAHHAHDQRVVAGLFATANSKPTEARIRTCSFFCNAAAVPSPASARLYTPCRIEALLNICSAM